MPIRGIGRIINLNYNLYLVNVTCTYHISIPARAFSYKMDTEGTFAESTAARV
jgi:hypothetical protein